MLKNRNAGKQGMHAQGKDKLERFSYDLEMKTREQNKRTDMEQLDLLNGYKRAWLLAGLANARVKKPYGGKLSRNSGKRQMHI